jgi:peptidyl-prolyl cis-trans isomerase A (cyclophilin A)
MQFLPHLGCAVVLLEITLSLFVLAMVRIINQRRNQKDQISRLWLAVAIIVVVLTILIGLLAIMQQSKLRSEPQAELDLKLLQDVAEPHIRGGEVQKNSDSNVQSVRQNSKIVQQPDCPYMKLNDLTNAERYPVAGAERHMVTPPSDGNVTLVCCHTTVGPWNVMVESSYFDTSVPLMRCIANFLCQFGLNGNPKSMKLYQATIPDDPNWLPEGPDHRRDPVTGVRRFNRGYMAYAGAGPHSRDNQFIVALKDNGPLAGGSPWEVPWGELVGNHSYVTLGNIYTGYDEKGPSQGLLHKANALEIVKEKYPLIDYIQSCRVVDSHVE